MPRYRLHYFPESGNSYKLALMLTLCGQKFEPVWTDFAGGTTRTPEWRKTVNEMGEIPVLEVDGVKMTQTAPILLQLAERYGRFGGETPEQEFALLRWLFWDNHKLTGYMASYRFMRTFAPNGDPQVLKHFRRRLDDFLGILDDIPNDKQMLDNEVLVPFENDTMLTISSPIWIDGAKKVQPRKPPGVGEHSDEILRGAGYDEAAIKQLRSQGAVG